MAHQITGLTGYGAQEAATPAPLLNSVDNSVGMSLTSLWDITRRIQSALDRLHGPHPKAVAKDVHPQSEPSNVISSLRNRADSLNTLAAELADAAQRLESIA